MPPPVLMPDYVIDAGRPWLGGYLEGGDEATIYPELWTWLRTEWGISSVLDIGCGEGHALKHFRNLECRVMGIDGIPQDDRDIFEHDYTKGPFPGDVGEYWLGWCCEFVEHVEEKSMPNFLDTFKHCRIVMMTHATPGQAGHHHVNNQTPSYWRGALAATGFLFDRHLTMAAREQAARNPHPSNHFVRSGMAFRRQW